MSFDPANGTLTLDGLDLVIGPELTKASFEAVAMTSGFEPFIANGAYTSFHAKGRVDGAPFSVVLWFENDDLRRVSLTIDDPEIAGTSWPDYDAERVRRFHDEWVEQRVGSAKPWNAGSFPLGGIERRFRWGTIGSHVHPQDLAASITISYG